MTPNTKSRVFELFRSVHEVFVAAVHGENVAYAGALSFAAFLELDDSASTSMNSEGSNGASMLGGCATALPIVDFDLDPTVGMHDVGSLVVSNLTFF
jgi:hypothetical protein